MAYSSSSLTGSWKYDVFLSFRGEDTRKTFVDHLYSALEQHGILTYQDDVTLDRGDTIGPSLLKAIEESQILVIIFSENYADSSWCLDELSRIMKCRDNETGQIVLPIFYHVDPSDVRKQKGKYGEAFAKHELSEYGKNKAETWKKVLFEASNIAGWESKHVANGHEAKCIKEIVGSILDKLSSSDSIEGDENLVGMEYRLEQLKSKLRIGSGGVRMVGIWGIGGGGKTTLATSLYKKFSPHFDGSCFLGNIREETERHGLQSLQEKILSTVFGKQLQVESVELGKHKIKQMLCHRKVFIVLDDVDHLDQLKALAGCCEWFGDGSRIIITTRDEHLLTTHRVEEVSPISLLSYEEAVRLLRRHAHHEDNNIKDYEELSRHIVYYAHGLPLALIVLGSFLYNKDKAEWLSILDRLKEHPEMDIVEKLKISYDGLTHVEKELFLDIACFYRGEKKDDAMEILDACGFYPNIGVKVLIQKALITISSEGCFDMHDLVQEMGHYIVRGKHTNNPEKHSRLWRKEDVEDICFGNATIEYDKVEAIKCVVHGCSSSFIRLVSKMKKLRFLHVTAFGEGDKRYPSSATMENDNIEATERPHIERHVRQHGGCSSSIIMLFSKMKELTAWFDEGEYRYIRSATMENDNSQMEKLRFPQVITTSFDEGPRFLANELRYIHWSGHPASLFPQSFQPRKLVVLKLIRSSQIEIWKGCKYLPCLKEMELSYMRALVTTPDIGGLPCLEKLILHGCESLEEIHQSLGNCKSLVYILVRNCPKLTRFPCIVRMNKMEILEIFWCKALVRTPDFGGLPCLQKLILNGCESLEEIHQSLGNHSSLVNVRVTECKKLTRFPTIVKMNRLETLRIVECGALVEFPKIEAKMDSLIKLSLTQVGIEVLPSSVGKYCTNLISLKLRYCGKLKSIQGNFHALKCLEKFAIEGFKRLHNIQQLLLPRCLRKLILRGCDLKDGGISNEVGDLTALRELDVSGNHFTRLGFSLSRLTCLKLLDLSHCIYLVELPVLPSSLAILRADDCWLLKTIIRDDIDLNCKWLCDVSIVNGRSNPIGWERLIESMLQGNLVVRGCIRLLLSGVKIPRVFRPCLVRGKRCRMQLPENWYNYFSGFLYFIASKNYHSTNVRMTHEKLEGDDDKSVVVDWLEDDIEHTYISVWYIPFGSLRNTLWWDPTSTAIQIEFESCVWCCGTTSISDFPSSSFDDVYTCGLNIEHDSKSTLDCRIEGYIVEKFYAR